MKSILVVSRESDVIRAIGECFRTGEGFDSRSTTGEALDALGKKRYDFIFIDVEILRESLAGDSYKSIFKPFWHLYPAIEIVVMSPPDRIRDAVMAVKAGASNYLTYPINHDEVKYVTESIYELSLMQSELEYLRGKFWQSDSLELVHTKSPLMAKVFEKVRSVAPTKSTVLLIGETGTGKGVLANLIHRHSNRKAESFISVHCGAIPETLLESELFGHEKGAFTGAVRRKLGKFEIAKGGTVFLDEIATVSPSAQVKLLQILQDGIFQRVGGEGIITADVRIIAATNMAVREMFEEGHFRRDLFYRLNVFPIDVPPLRQRKEDIPLLVEIFLRNLNKYHGKDIHDVDTDVMDAFEEYSWPGNIRELENLIERAYILEASSMLTPEGFPSELFASEAPPWAEPDSSLTLAEARRKGVESIENSYLNELLTANRGRIESTARAAGISTRQLHKLMKKYGLRKEDYKHSSAVRNS